MCVSVTTSVFSARCLSRPFSLASLLIVFEPRIVPPQSLRLFLFMGSRGLSFI